MEIIPDQNPESEKNEPPAEVRPQEISFAEASVSERYDDVYQWITPGEISTVRWREGAYEFICVNGVTLRVQVLTSGIVRLRYSPDGLFTPDFSYATDPAFTAQKVTVTLNENGQEYILESEKLQVVISKSDLRVKFYDQSDRAICEDAGGYKARRTIMKGWNEVRIEKKAHKKEVFLGLGDKACSTNLSGQKYQNWCSDAYGFGRESDAMYRAVPFYYALHQNLAYGIFLDNTFRTHFDFGATDEQITSFSAEGGELNYYFIYGPQLIDVARAYAQLTGTHELPPMWALGYHQCRWSYYPESRVQEIAGEFRRRQIPCDAIYLDIDYMDGYRCFTWNRSHFPDPKRMIELLREQGFQTVAMIDPGIKEDAEYEVYRDGIEQDMFIKTADGEVVKGPVWPGFCAFPDFTAPRVRNWWGELYRELYSEIGLSGFWNDMNEPAVFHVNHKTLPDHAHHHYEGFGASHRKAHNIYGQQMCRASWDGLKKLNPEKRPFLLTRAAYSGSQRFGSIWTGDNFSTWEHLQIANIQCQRLSVSGFSHCGTDIGGFAGNADGELFLRWLQLAVFHPLMRVHSMGQHESGDALPADEALLTDPALHNSDQEPWSFGEKYADWAKKAIELRYCLLPCLYTAMWLHTLDGTPVIRHMVFEDGTDPKLWDQERDFMFGEHLLVSPVVQAKVQRQAVYLPKGNWYYFWTGQISQGELYVNVMPDQIPFFVREGAVLPVYPIRQHTGENVEELTLYVYYKNGLETSHLYEDTGEGYGYKEGDFSLKLFETEGKDNHFTLRQRREGNYTPAYEKVKLYLVGFPTFLKKCSIDGVEFPIKELKVRERSLYTLDLSPEFNIIEWEG
ncbi:MAG: glycoside hydrolase family 31 protein [Saprospiraceae bacterium]|nr:glycoside hydrolase family 31 protein [Saprospiraceae bacterium]